MDWIVPVVYALNTALNIGNLVVLLMFASLFKTAAAYVKRQEAAQAAFYELSERVLEKKHDSEA